MLFSKERILEILSQYGKHITGVLHIGAHDCEEKPFYNNELGLQDDQIVWIDALTYKVKQCKARGIRNIYNLIVSERDNETVIFNITNNGQSSSILPLKEHLNEHPEVHVTHRFELQTTTLNTFFKRANLPFAPESLNFWNLDIQGAELLALRGGNDHLAHVDVIYVEVNTAELYTGCAHISDIDAFLSHHNFKRVATIMTRHRWGDAIYIKQ